jgi:predicted Ser/Thr protein kinase
MTYTVSRHRQEKNASKFEQNKNLEPNISRGTLSIYFREECRNQNKILQKFKNHNHNIFLN